MKVIQQSTRHHVLRFDSGEDVLQTLATHCESRNIFAASFQAIGAASPLTLSWYNLETKTYQDMEMPGHWEILNMTGNVSMKEGHIHIHAHGSFSDSQMNAKGGHVQRVVASPTCELVLTVLSEAMTRSKDETSGLYLLS